MNYADVLDMSVEDALWFAEKLQRNREEEAEAIEKQIADAKTSK